MINKNEILFKDTSVEDFYLQLKGDLYSKIGKYNEAKQIYLKQKKINHYVNPKDFMLFDAKETILKYSDNYKMIMINENHTYPEHRVFTTSILKELFKKGYRYLALEDINNNPEINQRSYAIDSDGFYIDEVMMADMVRNARALGFTLISYDKNPKRYEKGNVRDSLAALELKKIYKKDPLAKVIVHCGFGHINKKIKERLGYYVPKIIGIDPLTVSQTNTVLDSKKTYNTPMAINLLKQSTNFKFETYAEIQVLHPRYNYPNTRPSYLFENGRIKRVLKLPNIKNNYPIIIEVKAKGESLDAVPLDRIIINQKKSEVTISTLPRNSEVLIRNDKNELIKTISIN